MINQLVVSRGGVVRPISRVDLNEGYLTPYIADGLIPFPRHLVQLCMLCAGGLILHHLGHNMLICAVAASFLNEHWF